MALTSKPISIANVQNGTNGTNGKDGIAGKDGVGITDTVINYAQSTSGTVPPTNGWAAQVPTLVKGQYLWTRTVWTYSDATSETGYSVSYNSKDGNNGADGIPGKDGVGITSTIIEYATSTSGTVKPTTGWSTQVPVVTPGNYLWTRTTWQYSDSTSEQGFSVTRYGNNGTNGKDGVAGKDGVGVTSTVVNYTQSTSGTVTPTTGWGAQVPTLVKGQYLWTRTVWNYSDATTETGHSVSYNAKDGNNGADGIAGKDGVGITGTVINYASSTSGTVVPSAGWSTSIPTVTAGNYLWTRTVWTYSDTTSETGYSVTRYGNNGTNGTNGVSVVGVEASYAQSTSGTVTPTSGWSTDIPVAEVGKFMWTRTRNVLSNGDRTDYVYTVTLNGKEAVIISETAPTSPSVGTLWQKPSDATATVLKWNGTSWVNWGISVDNIVAENLTANNGVFEKVTGLEVEGGVIRNPYVRTYNDNSVATGSIVLADNQYTNSGYIFNPANQSYRVYSQEIGPQFISMNMYSASDPNTQTGLLNSAALTYDLLTLTDVAGGFSGILSARQLSSTLWQNLTLNRGFATSEGNTCQYRITYDLQNNTVIQLRGQVQRTSGTMTGTTYPFAAVPVPLRTSKNYFVAGIGDTERLQTTRLGIINSAHPTAANMIQIKHWGDSQYVDISGLSYLAG